MSAKSKTIARVAASLAEDPKVEQEVQAEIQNNAMVSWLLSLRVSKGANQEQIAASMGCDPSKISRLESGNDANLKWGDAMAYITALGFAPCVVLEDPSLPAAERIKRCVFIIREHLDQLTELASQLGGDDKIAKKIHEFSGEVLFNFLMHYHDHSEKLHAVLKFPPKRVKDASENIQRTDGGKMAETVHA